MSEKMFISKKEAQTMIGVSARTLDRMIMRQEIPYYKVGESRRATVRFLVADIIKYMKRFRNEARTA